MPLSLLVKVKNSRSGDIFASDTCVLVGSGIGVLVGSGIGVLVGSGIGVLVGSGIGVLVGSALACGGVVGTSWVHAGIMKRHTIVANISFNTIS